MVGYRCFWSPVLRSSENALFEAQISHFHALDELLFYFFLHLNTPNLFILRVHFYGVRQVFHISTPPGTSASLVLCDALYEPIKKGKSANQLSKEIHKDETTVLLMMSKIRKSMEEDMFSYQIGGKGRIVQADEITIGVKTVKIKIF